MKEIEAYNLCRDDWEKLIDQWVFNERNRAIIKRRLLDGVLFEKLAEEFGLSVQQVKSIVYKSQKRLMNHL